MEGSPINSSKQKRIKEESPYWHNNGITKRLLEKYKPSTCITHLNNYKNLNKEKGVA